MKKSTTFIPRPTKKAIPNLQTDNLMDPEQLYRMDTPGRDKKSPRVITTPRGAPAATSTRKPVTAFEQQAEAVLDRFETKYPNARQFGDAEFNVNDYAKQVLAFNGEAEIKQT